MPSFAVVSLPALAGTPTALNLNDIAWLRREGFDLDAANLARLRSMGREGLLQAQLAHRTNAPPLPPAINALLHSYPVLSTSPESNCQHLSTGVELCELSFMLVNSSCEVQGYFSWTVGVKLADFPPPDI